MNRFTMTMQRNLRKTGVITFPEHLGMGQEMQTNLRVLQAMKAQHPTRRFWHQDRLAVLRYKKGDLGIYTFWYE